MYTLEYIFLTVTKLVRDGEEYIPKQRGVF